MTLRKLEQKDAEFMLEWMHDSSVVGNLKNNFETKTIEDCRSFIVERRFLGLPGDELISSV